MKIRWLPIALGLSLAANLALAGLALLMAVDAGHYQSDQQSSWRWMGDERAELRAMRAHFCQASPAPDREAVLAWKVEADTPAQSGEPFDKDGLLWLDAVGVKFDQEGRLVGVCLPQTWGLLDNPPISAEDRAGEMCPLEPLC